MSSPFLPGGIYCKGQRLGNNDRKPFSPKRSFALPDILQSCIFHIHFMEHLILNLFPSKGLESDIFLMPLCKCFIVVVKVVLYW